MGAPAATRRFADEEIALAPDPARAACSAAPASGLDAALAAVERRRTLSVLDKTRHDWEGAKEAQPRMAHELQAHVRSAGTFVGKQAFLARAQEAEEAAEREGRARRAQQRAAPGR